MIERSCCIVPDNSQGNGDNSNRYLAGGLPGIWVACNPRVKQMAMEILLLELENTRLPDNVKKQFWKPWKKDENPRSG
jgi:hypothetical protein